MIDRKRIFERMREAYLGRTTVEAAVEAICDELDRVLVTLLETEPAALIERASLALAERAARREKEERAGAVPPTPLPPPVLPMRTLMFEGYGRRGTAEIIRVFWLSRGATDMVMAETYIQAQIPPDQYDACAQYARDNGWFPRRLG